MSDQILITRPDDWHAHLRDGNAMADGGRRDGARFARAHRDAEPQAPVVDVKKAKAYRDRILAALPKRAKFEPLMTLYLTDDTKPAEIARAKSSGFVKAVKYYPAGALTNSASGVTDIRKCDAVLEAMQAEGLPLLVHGEVTDPEVDIFDRETVFLDRVLAPLVKRFPKMRIVVEHITTHEAAAFVERASGTRGRHDHRASPAAQPQRDLRRRHQPAPLLHAGAQARAASPRAAQGRNLRQARSSSSARTRRRIRAA